MNEGTEVLKPVTYEVTSARVGFVVFLWERGSSTPRRHIVEVSARDLRALVKSLDHVEEQEAQQNLF